MRKLILRYGLLPGLMLLLSACNLPNSAPICADDELLAPVLVSPTDGNAVNTLLPTLTWAYPDPNCTPEGYRIDLSIDETFADTSLSGGTGNPSTDWSPGSDLQACQVYYWRVAPINGTTLGAFSEAYSFRVETGVECPPVAPPPSASVSGVVWHDLCAPPLESSSPAPVGCVALPGGGFQADGIRDITEPGIEGVSVNLHFGACSDPVVATQTTNTLGIYTFDGILAFGAHCISLDSLSSQNNPILIPGGWTFPSGTSGAVASASFNLESGSNLSQDFGWDYQFLPAPPVSASTPTVAAAQPTAPSLTDGFNVTVGANCRQGPGTVYDVVVSFAAGTNLRVVGRNQDSSWWQVEISTNNKCWISNVTGQFVGNATSIPTVAAPPTPTPGAGSPTPTGTITVTPTPDPNATATPTPTETPKN